MSTPYSTPRCVTSWLVAPSPTDEALGQTQLHSDETRDTEESVPTTYVDYMARRERLEGVPYLIDGMKGRATAKSNVASSKLKLGPETFGLDKKPSSDDAKQVLQKIKSAGMAGMISYGVVQLAFFGAAIPAGIFAYYQVAGHWPDLTNSEDQAQLAAEALAFLGFSRLLIPLRIAFALAMTKGVQTNIIDRFQRPTFGAAEAAAATSGASKVPGAAPGVLACSYCADSSAGVGKLTCGHCLSTGVVSFLDEQGSLVTQTCKNCDGSGSVVCINCQGSGVSIPEEFVSALGDAQAGFTEEAYIDLLDGSVTPTSNVATSSTKLKSAPEIFFERFDL